PILLFVREGENDVFTDAARQTLALFGELNDKIRIRELSLEDEKARELGIDHSPTLVFDPDHYAIRWQGAPMGEEGRILLEAILRIGTGKSGLEPAALAVLEKMNGPRKVKLFVSATCPYCPQQAVNALKAALARPDLVSLEIIDIQVNQELAAQYEAHSVPQAFANDIRIAVGAQTETLFVASLDKMEQQTVFIPDHTEDTITCQLVIVGAGPAGLTAGIYAARSGLKTVIVEKGVLGGQMTLTPVIENYPGMKQIGGKTLVDIMVTHALEYVEIFPGEAVVDIKPGTPLSVTTSRRTFITDAVLLATGATHRNLGVPGEDRLSGRGVSYCATCDGPLFRGKRVLIVGGGNTAVTEALHLHNMGVAITLIHRRDKLDAQEVLVKQLSENGIPVWYHTEVKEILGDTHVTGAVVIDNATGKTATIETDGVFPAIGYVPVVDLAKKVGLGLTENGYIQSDHFRTTIPDIYVTGDVSGSSKQIVIAAGHGAEAAMTIFEDIINPYWKNNPDK
ncbi:FAD-dependent oxidoreductase, partial [Desulfosarcina sp. OttesenSCG-928-A07]|nr:FAD-dependent oxidoreductase [Desulfosarcina sp. OttesenSCG-928-A07]